MGKERSVQERAYETVGEGSAYLALVEDIDHGTTAHAYLTVVLINGALRVANRWHVSRNTLDFVLPPKGGTMESHSLDDDEVVGVLALLLSRRRRLVEQGVSSDHVVDDGALADLLALELALGAEVAPVVVAEVVVRGDAEGLDAGVDEELGEDRLELRLAALEVVATDE